jgi:hypothetical protein
MLHSTLAAAAATATASAAAAAGAGAAELCTLWYCMLFTLSAQQPTVPRCVCLHLQERTSTGASQPRSTAV